MDAGEAADLLGAGLQVHPRLRPRHHPGALVRVTRHIERHAALRRGCNWMKIAGARLELPCPCTPATMAVATDTGCL